MAGISSDCGSDRRRRRMGVECLFSAVARRQAAAHSRIAAEQAITSVVTEYLGRIRAFELDTHYIYPESYAAVGGRERLAEDVLTQLPALGSARSAQISALLTELVGSKTMDAARLRLGVPADARLTDTVQTGQYEVIERQIRLGYHRGVGCKQELYRFCPDEHFPEVQAEYGVLGLLRLVLGHPHSTYRPEVQRVAIAKLQAILDQAKPQRVTARREEVRANVRAALGR